MRKFLLLSLLRSKCKLKFLYSKNKRSAYYCKTFIDYQICRQNKLIDSQVHYSSKSRSFVRQPNKVNGEVLGCVEDGG